MPSFCQNPDRKVPGCCNRRSRWSAWSPRYTIPPNTWPTASAASCAKLPGLGVHHCQQRQHGRIAGNRPVVRCDRPANPHHQYRALLPQIANFNFALRQISPGSRYCKMVLADDWIYPSCIAEMVALAETDPEIAIVSAYYHRDKHLHGSGLPCDAPDQVTTVVPGRDVCRLYLLGGCYVLGSPSTELNRSILCVLATHFFPN